MSLHWHDTLRFSCDWCNVVVDTGNFASLISDLCDHVPGLDENQIQPMAKGQNFYSVSYHYASAGYSAITFSYTPVAGGFIPVEYTPDHPQHGILVSISGDGCRFLRSLSSDQTGLKKFLDVLRSYPHTCTRLDMAMDIFDPDNPIVPLFQEYSKVAYDDDTKDHLDIRGGLVHKPGFVRYMPVYDRDVGKYVDNVYIGDRTSSRGHCVVYNKKEEVRQGRLRNIADLIFDSVGMTNNYWFRVEYRAKKGLAEPAFCALLDSGCDAAFYYIADNLFEFVDRHYDRHSISKCEVTVVWAEFLLWLSEQNSINFVELDPQKTPYVPATVARTRQWLFSMSSVLYKAMKIFQYDPEFRERIVSEGLRRHNANAKSAQFDYEMSMLYDVGLFAFEEVS